MKSEAAVRVHAAERERALAFDGREVGNPLHIEAAGG